MRPKIKICGLTEVENVRAVSRTGVDALGFVFYPPSKRYVTIAQSVSLVRAVPAFVSSVGLFVNPDDDFFDSVMTEVPLTLLQFHGDETPQRCMVLAQRARLPWIKALRMRSGVDVMAFVNQYEQANGWLLDADAVGYGGAGHTFDWDLIPLEVKHDIILSGGLNPCNISEAVTLVQPWAVDVSTGVETCPGMKDVRLVKQFVDGLAVV